MKEKEHGNTNVLCLSAAQTGADHAQRIVDAWLSTPFSGEKRHKRRLDKVADIERRGLGANAREQSA
jgi:ribose 5-phosphate isomerase RpiB